MNFTVKNFPTPSVLFSSVTHFVVVGHETMTIYQFSKTSRAVKTIIY